MKEPGVRPPGSLDPGAEEFRPTWILHSQYSLLQPHIYNPYLSYVTSGFNYRAPAAPTADVIPGPASRALQLSMMPRHVTEVTLRMELEAFGEVRTVELGRLAREGIVTVHFYDLRHAVAALVEIQEQCMRRHYMLGPSGRGLIAGHAVWAQFVDSTAEIAGKDGHNQGTVVIFNLDSSVSSSKLIEIFRAFGPVKEVSETPLKRQNVEFYDLRDAARALSEMNGKVLCGKHLVVQFSRSGRQGRRFCKPTAPSSSDAGYPPVPQFPLPPRPAGEQQHHSIVSPTTKASFNGRNGIENQKGENGSKRNFKKPSSRRFPCARHKKSFKTQSEYANFLFKEDEVEESNDRDSRTTVMIKNIPNKYSQELLLNMLDNHCTHCNEKIAEGGDEPLSSYDFVYLPIDFINKCNVGYGFVNLTSPEAAWRLYKSFHRQPWEVFNSRKICQVTYARLQGLDVLKEHFKKSKLACERDEYLPLVFSPPRDGKQLTQPLVIQGQPRTNFEKVVPTAAATTTTISSSRSTSNEESEDALELTDGGDSSVSNQIDGDEDENGDGGARGGDDDRSVVPPVVFGSSDFHTPSPIGAC